MSIATGEGVTDLRRAVIAPPRIAPWPGWHLGAGEDDPSPIVRLRLELFEQLTAPLPVPWVDGLEILLFPRNETSRAIALTGAYEPNELHWLQGVLELGMVFVDLGANIGLYTLFAARRVGPSGKVLAVEPSQREFGRLQRHVARNRLGNVSCGRVAVSDHRGEAELLVATEEHAGHNTLGSFAYDVQARGREPVTLARLDDLVESAGLDRVDVVKLDVEGAELPALQGALETIKRYSPMLLLELADRTLEKQGTHSRQVWQLLQDLGYTLHDFDAKSGLLRVAERKPGYDSENLVAMRSVSAPERRRTVYPTLIDRRNFEAEDLPPIGGVETFDQDQAGVINRARQEHLASLELPLSDKRVLDVGCGVGHHARFFVERGCSVVCTDAREENIRRLRELYPDREAHVVDVESEPLDRLGEFDIVYAYGLLYHLESPIRALRNMASVCRDLLLLETMVCDARLPLMLLADETKTFSQALRGLAHRPSPSYVAMALNRVGFRFVYAPKAPPDYPDFQFAWRDGLDWHRDGHPLRSVFVASRTELDNRRLVDLLAPPHGG